MNLYTISTGWQTVAAVQDLLEIVAPSDRAILVVGFRVHQRSLTAAGGNSASLKRVTGSPTGGSGGGNATVVAAGNQAGAHGLGTPERNNTSQISGGTIEVFRSKGFSQLVGCEWHAVRPDHSDALEIPGGKYAVLSLDVAPSSSTWNAEIDVLI